MTTKITIWNMALGFIGTRTVAAEDERTLEAIQCKLYWDNARRQALRDYSWNFAQRRAWLAEVPMLDGYASQYRFAYALPEDMLQALRIYSESMGGTQYSVEGQDFALVHDGMQKKPVLLCHVPKALLAYTADIEDVQLFDDLFVHMLARKLAAMVAVSLLKNNATKVGELEELYTKSIPSAVQANAKEGREKTMSDSWLCARQGGYGFYGGMA